MGLELYAKVESLLGIEEATNELHTYYFSLFQETSPKTLLDVGCGDGTFLLQCKNAGIAATGIDLSQRQIEKALEKKVTALCQDIEDTTGEYEVITIIFDVVNFIKPTELKIFFGHVERLLTPNGKLLFDVNTQYGFEEVAQGVMTDKSTQDMLVVDAVYEDEMLTTDFTLFEKQGKTFVKHEDTIVQYYHTLTSLIKATNLSLSIEMPIELYGEEPDKTILLFTKDA